MKGFVSFICVAIALLVGYSAIWMKIINCYFAHSEELVHGEQGDLFILLHIVALVVVLLGIVTSCLAVDYGDKNKDDNTKFVSRISSLLFGGIGIVQGVTAGFTLYTLSEGACYFIWFIDFIAVVFAIVYAFAQN